MAKRKKPKLTKIHIFFIIAIIAAFSLGFQSSQTVIAADPPLIWHTAEEILPGDFGGDPSSEWNFPGKIIASTALVSDDKLGIGTKNPSVLLALNSQLGGTDVGITQALLGGANTMELTTADSSGTQTTRLLLRSGDNADVEFYSGASGAESKTMVIEGANGRVGIGSDPTGYMLTVGGGIRTYNSNMKSDGDIIATANTYGTCGTTAYEKWVTGQTFNIQCPQQRFMSGISIQEDMSGTEFIAAICCEL
jgi:hypothetical protein